MFWSLVESYLTMYIYICIYIYIYVYVYVYIGFVGYKTFGKVLNGKPDIHIRTNCPSKHDEILSLSASTLLMMSKIA